MEAGNGQEALVMRSIQVKFVGGPKDGEVVREETPDRLPVCRMALATEGHPYLIRRKLTAAIYEFERWSEDPNGPPQAEFSYVRTEDHTAAHATIENRRSDTVPVPR